MLVTSQFAHHRTTISRSHRELRAFLVAASLRRLTRSRRRGTDQLAHPLPGLACGYGFTVLACGYGFTHLACGYGLNDQ